jgi:hypothetical protein
MTRVRIEARKIPLQTDIWHDLMFTFAWRIGIRENNLISSITQFFIQKKIGIDFKETYQL